MSRRWDKLDRCCTLKVAVLTMKADVPFWVSLTRKECRRMGKQDKGNYFRSMRAKRKAFRDFIRSLCERKGVPS